jgi:phosphoribosylformimino-5-aminoimidazole carboxamide ribotide isomerase
MILLPAIDLMDGSCVRLSQGVFNHSITYNTDPLLVAKSFEQAGAKALHIVDLDAAKGSTNDNEDTIKNIVKSIRIPIQVGGGVRDLDKAQRLLSAGVSKVIVGTLAIENQALLAALCQTFPKRIIVSLDAKNGMVAIKGWKEITNIRALDLCQSLEKMGVDTIVYTDISKDGMLEGPNFTEYQALKDLTTLNIIASGGISSIDDLLKLQSMGLYGAIVGKALYENKFDLKGALSCLQNASSLV